MARTILTGTRVRDRRMLLGVKQAALARDAGISAAYLNLIEHNRRNVGQALIARLAGALGVPPEALADGAESALTLALREAAADAGGIPPETARVEEFTSRFPGWAARVAELQATLGLRDRVIARLGDRMAHDPHLAATLHEVLSAVTALRATGAILAGIPDLPKADEALFLATMGNESARLAEAATGLAAWLDAPPDAAAALSPQDEVAAWLENEGWHLAALERGGSPAAVVEAARGLTSGASRALAFGYAESYRADARALPLARLRGAVAAGRMDPMGLAASLGLPPALVMRRIATLPVGETAPNGLVVCDGSGTLVFRKPLAGFPVPRFGAACPIWPLYEALWRPQSPVRADLAAAGQVPLRFRAWAVCDQVWSDGYDAPPVVRSAMLIVPADGPATGRERPVGSTCRVCPRPDCAARHEPSIMEAAATVGF
jgi:transcriptional regulator with XRE-family HTH domain